MYHINDCVYVYIYIYIYIHTYIYTHMLTYYRYIQGALQYEGCSM